MTKQTLTFKELIDFTGMTRKQLQAWIDAGLLKFINTNISGSTNIRYRFLTSQIESWLENIQQTMGEARK